MRRRLSWWVRRRWVPSAKHNSKDTHHKKKLNDLLYLLLITPHSIIYTCTVQYLNQAKRFEPMDENYKGKVRAIAELVGEVIPGRLLTNMLEVKWIGLVNTSSISGYTFWMGECISMFGYSCMIGPQGGPPVGLSWLIEAKAPLDCPTYEVSGGYWPIPTGLLNTSWYPPDYPVRELNPWRPSCPLVFKF